MKAACPKCGQMLEMADEMGGESVSCAACGADFIAPIAPAKPAPPQMPRLKSYTTPLLVQFLRAIGYIVLAGGFGLGIACLFVSLGGASYLSGIGGAFAFILLGIVLAFPFFAIAQIVDAITRTAHESRTTNDLLLELLRTRRPE